MKDDEFDDVFSKESFVFTFEDWYKVDGDFFRFDKIDLWLDFFEHLFDHEFELIHFLSAEPDSIDRAIGVVDTHKDGSAFGVHESDYGFEECLFEVGLFDGEGVVFEFYSHGLEWEFFPLEEVPFTS